MLSSFAGKKVLTKIDQRKGYMQIRIRKKDRHRAAFRAHIGCYVFLNMALGLKIYQRIMDQLFAHLVARGVLLVFQVDILILTRTIEDHWGVLSLRNWKNNCTDDLLFAAYKSQIIAILGAS